MRIVARMHTGRVEDRNWGAKSVILRMLATRLLGRVSGLIFGLGSGRTMANHLSYDVLSRLVERHASPVEQAKAQRHLSGCGRCRSELAWLERIRSLPQRTADSGQSLQAIDGVGDGWGNLGQARPASAAAASVKGLGRAPDGRARGVAPYWQRGASSALPS